MQLVTMPTSDHQRATFGELRVGASFEATVKTPRVFRSPARTYKNCLMVKLYDVRANQEVAVIVDDMPRRIWRPSAAPVDQIMTERFNMVYMVSISQETKVKAHPAPISSENIHSLEGLLSSATIRVTYNQAKQPAIVDISKHNPMKTLD
jgi:hypothetical protein